MSKPGYLLAADIGGTKTYLGLFDAGRPEYAPIRVERYLNVDFDSIEEVVGAFLAGIEEDGGVVAASFGVAGPVASGRAYLTNLGWTVDSEALKQSLGTGFIHVLNDLAAMALGISGLGEEDLAVVKPGEAQSGNIAVLAAGTGLGESILYWDGSVHHAIAGEGGHVDFAARTDQEDALRRWLSKRYGHVSYERVLSGDGLVNIYNFLRESSGGVESAAVSERFESEDTAAVISGEALGGGDPLCSEALSLFVSILGGEAGNLALKSLAAGGVYIGGGIAPRILEALRGGGFVEGFLDKGRMKEFLLEVPVYVVLNERVALIGAAVSARGLLR